MARKRQQHPTSSPQQAQVETTVQKMVTRLTLFAGFVVAVDKLVEVFSKLLDILF